MGMRRQRRRRLRRGEDLGRRDRAKEAAHPAQLRAELRDPDGGHQLTPGVARLVTHAVEEQDEPDLPVRSDMAQDPSGARDAVRE